MEQIISMINNLDTFVWGWPMIVLLLGTHLIMTGATGGIQRKIGTAIKLSVTKDTEAEGEVSLEHWQLHLHLLLEPVTLLVWGLPFIWEAQVQFSGAG